LHYDPAPDRSEDSAGLSPKFSDRFLFCGLAQFVDGENGRLHPLNLRHRPKSENGLMFRQLLTSHQ
ncbi:MAG: hypothetical protein KC419_13130, partial [Anaerolineales bacterium]|nr:hypothetical protein [Anaerolineales bacterium]